MARVALLLSVASVVALLADGAPASATVVPSGSVVSPSTDQELSGCGAASAPLPRFSIANDSGRMRSSAYSRICSRGNGPFGSEGDAATTLTIEMPVRLATGPGGVNVSFRISAALADSGSVAPTARCAVVRQSDDYDFGYTWYNYSQMMSTCYALGSAQVEGTALLEDLSTGATYSPSNAWTGAYNVSGRENSSFSYRGNYSNASDWSLNASGSYSLNASYGSSGSVAGTWYPTWFINGSFRASDRYRLEVTLSTASMAESYGYRACSASASVDLWGSGRGLALTGLTTW